MQRRIELRKYKKFLSAILLLPLVALFALCCCLKAEAATTHKSACASCPQKENKEHSQECPHAKIKAIFDAKVEDLSAGLSVLTVSPLFCATISPVLNFAGRVSFDDTSPCHSFHETNNPVLRV